MILSPRYVEKPWGVCDLPGWLEGGAGRRIGEIWFEAGAGTTMPLLVKYIFTSAKLSVQVHPGDDEARARGLPRGKDEGWYIVSAQDDATLGIGTHAPLSDDALRKAAQDGSIEALMQWHPARAGDYFYVPAGTVHAIGPGVGLIEVQPNVDVTYRLYDYGRPRELHLGDGVAVAQAQPYDAANRERASGEGGELPTGSAFRLWRQSGSIASDRHADDGTYFCIPLDGAIRVDDDNVARGQCAMTRSLRSVNVPPETSLLIASPH